MASSPSKTNMANSPSNTKNKLTMKLLIDTKEEKVLFAEASKPVIDFLFNLLCLPIGTVVSLLNENGMVGSLGNLYRSVENLNDNYMVPNPGIKDVILKPKSPITGLFVRANDDNGSGSDTALAPLFFICRNNICPIYVTCDNTTLCPHCGRSMSHIVRFIGNKKVGVDDGNSIKSGFVKEIIAFMIMDDLVVEPMSTISSVTLLNKFNVKDVGVLQEMVVELGMDECVKLLKASLESNMVLTSLFIKKEDVKKEDMKKVNTPKKKRRRRHN